MSEDSHFGASSGSPAGGKSANQDYGFFASTPAGAPSQLGGQPAGAMSPPAAASPGQPAPGQYSPPPPAPPGPFGAPPPYGPPAYPAPPRSGLPVWAIVAICVPVAFVMLGILAAIAIPVFLNQRDKAVAAATSVSLPDEIAGLSPSGEATLRDQLEGMENSLPRCGCFGRPQATVYIDPGRTHALTVGAARVTTVFHSADQASFVRGFWDSVQSSPAGANVGEPQEQDAGKLGGILSCAALTGRLTGEICVAVDAGSFFFTSDVYQGGAVDRSLPRTAREAVVHRH
jgi:hypothetical protein